MPRSILALIAALALAFADVAPYLALVPLAILLGRAAHGLSRFRKPTPAKVIGFTELGLGALTVALIALGYALEF